MGLNKQYWKDRCLESRKANGKLNKELLELQKDSILKEEKKIIKGYSYHGEVLVIDDNAICISPNKIQTIRKSYSNSVLVETDRINICTQDFKFEESQTLALATIIELITKARLQLFADLDGKPFSK